MAGDWAAGFEEGEWSRDSRPLPAKKFETDTGGWTTRLSKGGGRIRIPHPSRSQKCLLAKCLLGCGGGVGARLLIRVDRKGQGWRMQPDDS